MRRARRHGHRSCRSGWPSLLAAILAASLAGSSAAAQSIGVADLAPPSEGRPIEFSVGYEHVFTTDIDKAGNFERDAVSAHLRSQHALTDDFTLIPIFRYENLNYDFSNGARRLGYSWSNVNFGAIGLLGQFQINPKLRLLAGGVIRHQGEASADFDDSLDGGGVVGILFEPHERLEMGFLVGVVTEIEGDVAFLPVPIIRWRAGDELTFNFGPTQVAARNGIGPQLVWHPIEELDFAVGGAFSNRRFRLDDHGRKSRQGDPRCQPPPPDPRVGCDPIGRSVDGVGQDRSFPIYARIGFRPTRSMGLEIFGGVALGGELIVEEEGGDQIQTEEYDPAPIFGLRGHIRF